MSFPNMLKSIKTVIASTILMIIVASLAIVLFFLTLFLISFGIIDMGTAIIIILLMSLLASAIDMAAGILMIIALSQASRDEPRYFRKAFFFSFYPVVSFIPGILLTFFLDRNIASTIATVLSCAANVTTMILTIYGINDIAEKLGRKDIMSSGRTTLVILVIGRILESLNSLCTVNTLYEINVVNLLITMVQFIIYFFYIHYLNNIRDMLADNIPDNMEEE